MRKAVWGAILLGVFALTLAWPIRDAGAWHRPISSIALIVGFLLLSLDPPEHSKRQRQLFIAAILCSLGSFMLAFLDLPYVGTVLSRILAMAVVALPVWLVAGPFRAGFIAAGVLALASILIPPDSHGAATSTHAYVAGASVLLVAAMLHNPAVLKLGGRKPPRRVVASNIVTYTPDQKARALERLEARYRAGDMPEHVYLDKRQELESR